MIRTLTRPPPDDQIQKSLHWPELRGVLPLSHLSHCAEAAGSRPDRKQNDLKDFGRFAAPIVTSEREVSGDPQSNSFLPLSPHDHS